MNRLAISLSLSAIALAVLACAMPGSYSTPTPHPCPAATPEAFYVEPVPATTDAQAIVVRVFLGNMEEITIVTESGVFTSTTGEVEVALLPGTEHHLEVRGKVKEIGSARGCLYGGYTLTTRTDRNGNPLTVTQGGGPTPTICPLGTPEPLLVDPVPAESTDTKVTLTVLIGNGDQVAVETESGLYVVEGDFGYANLAVLEVPLVPDSVNHIKVSAHVRPTGQPGGCQYGDYVLSTTVDREGNALVIVQRSP